MPISWVLQHFSQIVVVVIGLVVFILLIRALARALRKPLPAVSVRELDPPIVDIYSEQESSVSQSPSEARAAEASPPAPSDLAFANQTAPESVIDMSSGTIESMITQVVERPTEVSSAPPVSVLVASTAPVITQDSVTYVQLEPHHLKKLGIVAQALDNQWESRSLLRHMQSSFSQGRALGLPDIRNSRYEAGRGEYMRALVNAEQLVVNRVFLYNTDYVAQDYVTGGPDRDSLKELLSNGVIVPYLHREQSPAARPVDVNVTHAHEEWEKLCHETNVQAVRLSWDDDVNEERARQLSGSFAVWLNNLGIFRQYGDPVRLAGELGLPTDEDSVRALQRRFREVANWAQEEDFAGRTVMRGAFYRKFIVVDGSDVTDGIIDFAKPFASELKQIADLSYATNLPDALGGYALTPMDSLPRTALQELTFRTNSQIQPITPDEIMSLLQRQVFDLIAGGLFLNSMSRLTLRDVIALRATDEWLLYTNSMKTLLDKPLDFRNQAQIVYSRYIALAQRMTKQVARNDTQNQLERWVPVLKLVLTIGSAAVTLEWHSLGSLDASGQVLFSVAEGAINRGASMTARLIIGGIAERRAEAQLETSLDFMRRSLADANGTFQYIVGWLKSQRQYRDISGQRDTSQDEVDPNINMSD